MISKLVFYMLLFVIFLSPTVAPPFRFEDIIIFFSVLIMLHKNWLKMPVESTLLTLFLISILPISILVGNLNTYNSIVLNDFFFAGMVVKYYVLFLIIYNLKIVEEIFFEDCLRVIVWLGVVSGLIAFGQYFNTFRINSWLTPYYISQEFYLDFLNQGAVLRRTIGTSFNPNHFAFLLSFPIISASVLVWVYKKKRYIIPLLFLYLAMITTLSRTGIVVSAFSVIFGYILWVKIKKSYFSMILMVITLALIIIVFRNLFSSYEWPIYERFSGSQLEISGSNSLSARIESWKIFWEWFVDLPQIWTFGIGPQKGSEVGYIDNQYISLIRQFGILGLFSITCIQLCIMRHAFQYFFKSNNVEGKAVSLVIVCLLTSLLSFQMTAEAFNDLQNMSIVLVFVAIFYKKRNLDRKRLMIS